MSSLAEARAVLAQAHAQTSLAAQPAEVLAVPEALRVCLPGSGLRRGVTIGVCGSSTLLFALISQAATAGAWVAVVGMPEVGLLAAHEWGIDFDRCVVIPTPGTEAATIIAALVDGVDIVIVGKEAQFIAADCRGLAIRARERGAILLPVGPWPNADVVLTAQKVRWEGVDAGEGFLRYCTMNIARSGRGAAGVPMDLAIQLQAPQVTSLVTTASNAFDKTPRLIIAHETATEQTTTSRVAAGRSHVGRHYGATLQGCFLARWTRSNPKRNRSAPNPKLAGGSGMSARIAVIWVPDWPVAVALAAGDVPAHEPAAVGGPHGLVAVSAAARAHGVTRGMGKRQAQALCPAIHLFPLDEVRDARAFEVIAQGAETIVAGVEVVRPGLLVIPAAGAARYWGSEEKLANQLMAVVVATSGFESYLGIADGLLAGVLAATKGVIVPSDQTAAFLAPQPVATIGQLVTNNLAARDLADMVNVWRRLGIYTLGDLAAIPAASIITRFGAVGAWAHSLASGAGGMPTIRRPEQDIAVGEELDPPIARIDQTAFIARRLAEQLHSELIRHNKSAGRIRIIARTDAGLEFARTWRTDIAVLGGLEAARITDRVRWQLEGWISTTQLGGELFAEEQMLSYVGIVAEEVVTAGTHQEALWGRGRGKDAKAHRALLRVQSLLGSAAVLTPVLQGGRTPQDRIYLVPWGQTANPPLPPDRPWPGQLPAPSPVCISKEVAPLTLTDEHGSDISVSARLELSGKPAWACFATRKVVVTGWSRPWPLRERWWAGNSRRVFMQLLLADGDALLAQRCEGAWTVAGHYE